MNINLRISTDSINTAGSSCQSDAPMNPVNDGLTSTSSNNQLTPPNTASLPQPDTSGSISSPSSQGNSNININNQISTGSSPLESINSPTTSAGSNPENKTNDDWAKSLLTEMKGMLDTFLTSLTKMIESIFGAKANQATQNTPPQDSSPNQQNQMASTLSDTASTSGTSSTVPKPARVVESFIAHTAKTLGSDLNNISEEKMRESVIMYQLYQKDEGTENVFKAALTQNKSNGKSSDEAIKAALIETEKSNKIERWESDWVYSLSFQAAQLDNDQNKISGSSVNLPAATAIQTAERNLISIATGASTPFQRSIAA